MSPTDDISRALLPVVLSLERLGVVYIIGVADQLRRASGSEAGDPGV